VHDAAQCATGFCVNGVCCDSACTGGCGSCSPVRHGRHLHALASARPARRRQRIARENQCNGTSLTCQHPVGNAAPSVAPPPAPATSVRPAPELGDLPRRHPESERHLRRAVAGTCDLAEVCTGTSASCPADALKAAGTSCRRGTPEIANMEETCTGARRPVPPTARRRRARSAARPTGDCDRVETCSDRR
jgi:hypothetical protein